MNIIVNNQENFQTNLSIHNINTRNKHHFHRPNAIIFILKKVHSVLASEFSTVYHLVLWNEEAKFKAALRKHLNTHFFYSVGEFFCVQRLSLILFHKMFVVIVEILCILCIYDLFHFLFSF